MILNFSVNDSVSVSFSSFSSNNGFRKDLFCVFLSLPVTDAAFPRVDPNRLQFFEYDSIFVNCEGFDISSEWRVMRKLKEDPTNTNQWETSSGSITIEIAFASDSGEYWCENKQGERSDSINITVTGIYQPTKVILDCSQIPKQASSLWKGSASHSTTF